jgi:heme oxygenase
MSNLKELTWEHHKNAERQVFVKELLSGNISNERYAQYLYNQHPAYDLLEALATRHGLFDDIMSVKRASAILEDFNELWDDESRKPNLCPVVQDYIDHLRTIMDDKDKIMAHVYVRHMGDLSGGQIIAKRVPGKGLFYKFDNDVETIKDKIRTQINDSMAEEAKLCFDFAARLFHEMMEVQP